MKATTKTVAERISPLDPCPPAVRWCRGYTSPARAWQECQRGDWMLWVLGRVVKGEPWSDRRKPLLSCALECAELSKRFWPAEVVVVIDFDVKILRRWIAGKSSTKSAVAAYNSILDASYQVSISVDYACEAAAQIPAVAYAAAENYANLDGLQYQAHLAACADIVRKHFPKPPVLKGVRP